MHVKCFTAYISELFWHVLHPTTTLQLQDCWPAMGSLQEWQKHVSIALEGTKRRFDDSEFGGRSQSIAAAKRFVAAGNKLMFRFDLLKKKPVERKEFVRTQFGDSASYPSKSIAAQKAVLVSKLVGREVPVVEASVMEAAMHETPGLNEKGSLSLTYDGECEKFKATLQHDGENMSKSFATPKEAKNWLLSMGKSSEARWVHRYTGVWI